MPLQLLPHLAVIAEVLVMVSNFHLHSVWGKRHLYILGTILLVVGSVWGGAAKTYKSLLWARIIQGVAVTPFEALVNASIGDL